MNLNLDAGKLMFRTSSYTDKNDCLEVADFTGGSAVRDSKNRDSSVLAFGTATWNAFLTAIKHDALP